MIAHTRNRLARIERLASPRMAEREVVLESEAEFSAAYEDVFFACTGPTRVTFRIVGGREWVEEIGTVTHEDTLEMLQ